MTRLSIIIPAGGEVSLLEDTLVSVLANRPAQCEVVVPHAGNYDDPYDLKDEVRFLKLPRRTGTAEQIAAALQQTSSPFVHLLATGCEVDEGWCSPALSRLSDPNVASVAPLVFRDAALETVHCAGVSQGIGGRRVEQGRGLSATSHRLARLHIAGPASLAAFYRRDALDDIGGWPTVVGLLADLDAALSLRRLGYESVIEHGSHVIYPATASERVSAYARARHVERLYWRHSAGLVSRVLHPAVMLAQCLTAGGPLAMIIAAAGKLTSVVDIPAGRRHRRQLAQQCEVARQRPVAQDTDDPPRRAA